MLMKIADVLKDAVAWGACKEALVWLHTWPRKTISPDDPLARWAAWYAHQAGRNWPDERWQAHGTELVAAICLEPQAAGLAADYWADQRRALLPQEYRQNEIGCRADA